MRRIFGIAKFVVALAFLGICALQITTQIMSVHQVAVAAKKKILTSSASVADKVDLKGMVDMLEAIRSEELRTVTSYRAALLVTGSILSCLVLASAVLRKQEPNQSSQPTPSMGGEPQR